MSGLLKNLSSPRRLCVEWFQGFRGYLEGCSQNVAIRFFRISISGRNYSALNVGEKRNFSQKSPFGFSHKTWSKKSPLVSVAKNLVQKFRSLI